MRVLCIGCMVSVLVVACLVYLWAVALGNGRYHSAHSCQIQYLTNCCQPRLFNTLILVHTASDICSLPFQTTFYPPGLTLMGPEKKIAKYFYSCILRLD